MREEERFRRRIFALCWQLVFLDSDKSSGDDDDDGMCV